jgi:hypothetical protein
MKMSLGNEASRAIMVKYRQRLKALLCEHEVKTGHRRQMILLVDLCNKVQSELENTDSLNANS